MEDVKVSIVIASYERPEALEANLQSLCFWPSIKYCEVVITDDNSPHVGLIEKVIDKFWDKLRITFIKANAAESKALWFYQELLPDGGHYNSATYAYNVSVQNTIAPLLMYCGYDLIHLKDNISAALTIYDEAGSSWESLVLIGTEFLGTAAANKKIYSTALFDPTILLDPIYLAKRSVHPKRNRPLLHIGCVSRKLLFEVGGMNEMLLGGFAFSDEDLGVRLSNAGGDLQWTKDLMCLHPTHDRPDCLYGNTGRKTISTPPPYFRNRNIVQLIKAGKIINPNKLVERVWGHPSKGMSIRSWKKHE